MSAIPGRDVDRHIGARIRLRRKSLGMSQSDVAAKIGLSYQQFQKYETGDSRVTASGLYEIGTILDVPVEWFFEGLPSPAAPVHTPVHAVNELLMSHHGLRLAEAFVQLPAGPIRARIADLLEAMALDGDGGK